MPEGLEGDGLGESDALRVVRMGGRYICGSSMGGSVRDEALSPICMPTIILKFGLLITVLGLFSALFLATQDSHCLPASSRDLAPDLQRWSMAGAQAQGMSYTRAGDDAGAQLPSQQQDKKEWGKRRIVLYAGGPYLEAGCKAGPLRAGLGMHGQGHAVRAAQRAAGAHERGPGRVLQGLQAHLLAPVAPVRQLPGRCRLHIFMSHIRRYTLDVWHQRSVTSRCASWPSNSCREMADGAVTKSGVTSHKWHDTADLQTHMLR